MNATRNRQSREDLHHPETGGTAPHSGVGPRVIIIGTLAPAAIANQGGDAAGMIAPEEITAGNLAALRPDVVLTPLVGPGFDCFDVALALCEAGYSGQLRAVVNFVPNPALVRREIAFACPALDFDLIVTGPARAGHNAADQ
jgi:hypothetical protein